MSAQPAMASVKPAREALYTPAFWQACAIHFAGAMGLSMFILFPLYVRQLGGDEVVIGLIASASTAAAVAIRWPVGLALDRGGRRLVLCVASGVHALVWPLLAATHAVDLALIALVLLQGLAGGTLFATYFTVASDIIPASRRSEGLAIFGVWGMLPNGLGPALGEQLIQRSGFGLYFAVAAGFAAISLLLATRVRNRSPSSRSGPTFPTERKRAPLALSAIAPLLGTTLLFGFGVSSLFTFLAPFVHESRGATAGPFFLAYALTATIVRILGGHLPDRIGRYRILLPALMSYAVGVGTAGFAAVDPRVLLLSGILCGIGHGYAFPILTTLVIERTPPAAYGMAVSLFTAMFDLGETVGNSTLGVIARGLGYRSMFRAAMATSALAVILAYASRRR